MAPSSASDEICANAEPRTAGHHKGDPGYAAITAALFAAGMATFISMYAAQAVLPELATQFHTNAATSALAVSVTTGVVAFSIVPASILSERFGRSRVMAASALLSAFIGIVIPFAHTLTLLLVGRALQGLTLAGVPAVAMAYLAEEVADDSLGSGMGRYIAGTTLGGLAGRLIAALTLDVGSWRLALEVAAVAALIFTGVFVRLAPPSKFFTPKPIGFRQSASNITTHLRNARVMALVAIAFVLMGGFVSIYNLLGFRLLARPFHLSASIVGLVFCLYLAGTFTSAWAGVLADRWGKGPVLVGAIVVMGAGLIITVPDNLADVLVGMLLTTGGFFAAHSTASGWVGALATSHRAEASSLYLFGYYSGSSIIGALAGLPYGAAGWSGALMFVLVLTAVGLTAALWLWHGERHPAGSGTIAG